MIKKWNAYENTQAYGSFQALPRGAYKLIVKGAKEETYKNGNCIKLAIDIADGEFAGYYQRDFDSNTQANKKWHGTYLINEPKDDGTDKDNKVKRWFKTTMDAFESSNAGYRWNWDELSLKGKKIAGCFITREYVKNDGTIGKMTVLRRLISIDDFNTGNFQMPSDELMDAPSGTQSDSGFVPVQSVSTEDLPF